MTAKEFFRVNKEAKKQGLTFEDLVLIKNINDIEDPEFTDELNAEDDIDGDYFNNTEYVIKSLGL